MLSAISNGKKAVFFAITLLCLLCSGLYILLAVRRDRHNNAPERSASHSVPEPPSFTNYEAAPLSSPSRDEDSPRKPLPKSSIKPQPSGYLVSLIYRDEPNKGKVEYVPLNAMDGPKTVTNLSCERIHFAAGNGICLSRHFNFFSAQTIATVIDSHFQPLFTVENDGIPSRARISPDGRYGAFTVFVTGHSYADPQMSTATILVNMSDGTSIANLEEFEVIQDGRLIKSPDFNYWGVTFQRNSNFFYATLRTGGVNHLVHGDISKRMVQIIYSGVECPSLSPDEKQIAFKKLVSRNRWRLTVLNLASLRETPTAETENVEDQAEWLDNTHVLYGITDVAPWMSVMVVPSDGTGEPKLFAKGAASPAIVRGTIPNTTY